MKDMAGFTLQKTKIFVITVAVLPLKQEQPLQKQKIGI